MVVSDVVSLKDDSSGWTRFPTRLVGQPIFYRVLNEDYATKIARDSNTEDPVSGHVGHVLRFEGMPSFFSSSRRIGSEAPALASRDTGRLA